MPRQFETENNIRQQDLEELVNNSVFDKFRDKTVLITVKLFWHFCVQIE